MSDTPAYKNPALPVEERVENLLARMTVEEKVGQMVQLCGRDVDPTEWITESNLGSLLYALGPRNDEVQATAAGTRLGIPLIIGIDAIHGNAFWAGATVFPSQLAMAASWNPELVEQVGRATAKETRCVGAHWTFSPVAGVARDLRWGRVDETFGEDPHLAGELVAAIVRGYQGDDLTSPDSILACVKHYAGYCETQGGRDASEADLSERKLRSYFLPSFEAAVRAGCATVMTGYQSIDGTPCTANRWLMTEVLRDEWGFDGFVVTDWNNVGRLVTQQKVFATMEEASIAAVEAGNDMIMTTPAFYEATVAAVHAGRLDEALLDRACRRILRAKFRLGLFDGAAGCDMDHAAEMLACQEHMDLAFEAACQSIVLLKNDDALLPLDGGLGAIAVIGPNADDEAAQIGDWTYASTQHSGSGTEPAPVTTVLKGIRRRAPEGCRVDYCRGCAVIERDAAAAKEAAEQAAQGGLALGVIGEETAEDAEIQQAAALAADADVAVVVVGDDISLNGECRDRADLNLTGRQQELLEAVHATGTPMVVVLVSGKPLTVPWVAEHAAAVVQAWNPGVRGGEAVAAVLFGDRNPSGRLPVTFARHVGQLPVYYNQIPGWHAKNYADMTAAPLWPFGFGLSYTTFAFSALTLSADEITVGDGIRVEVTVENTGPVAGTEVVQVYVNDVVSSVTTPVKQLKAFARVDLAPGEKKTVALELPPEAFLLINADCERVIEPGEFEIMAGPSSRDEDLVRATLRVK